MPALAKTMSILPWTATMRSTRSLTALARLTSTPRLLTSGGPFLAPVGDRPFAGTRPAASPASPSDLTACSAAPLSQSAMTTFAPAWTRISANA